MGSPSFLGAVGREAGVEVLILIPKETFKTCNFPGGGGGGGVRISWPPPLYGFRNQENW